MKTSDAILMALLIVLILAIAYKLTSRGCNREGMMNGESYGFLGGGSYGFLGAEGETFASPYEGRADVNRRLDMSRGNYRGNDYPYIPQNNNWEYPNQVLWGGLPSTLHKVKKVNNCFNE